MNLFIEGIPGSGKSTLLNKYAMEHPEYQFYREGDCCPVELAWCAYMTEEEYRAALVKYRAISEEIERWTVREPATCETGLIADDCEQFPMRYIVPYTRIITDELGFHKYMEQFEIYQGRKSPEEFQQIILGRSNAFFESQGVTAAKTLEMPPVTIMECAFFQNILEELMLFFECSDQEIFEFYKKLFSVIPEKEFQLYYLYDQDVEKIVGHIAKERSDSRGNMLWYPMLLAFLQESPYGKKHAFQGMEDVVAHFKRRQKLELWIIREILGEHGLVIPAKSDYKL